jgi:type VI secretion system protein ImpA
MLTATSAEELARVLSVLDGCLRSLKSIEALMRDRGGAQAAPDFSALTVPLARTLGIIATHADARAPAQPSGDSNDDESSAGGAGVAIGQGGIRSRDDAVRALDAVAAFFRTSEPSSPVPMFIERAKRLVAKDFLSVLEDIAPDALAQAKAVGGVRDNE